MEQKRHDTPPVALAPLLHIALRLGDKAQATALRNRLHLHNVAVSEIADLGRFLFYDGNGMALEITTAGE